MRRALSKPKGGWAEGRTELHGGDGADVPARQVGIEGGGSVEHCAREGESEGAGVSASQRGAGRRDALARMSVTELTSQEDKSALKEEA